MLVIVDRIILAVIKSSTAVYPLPLAFASALVWFIWAGPAEAAAQSLGGAGTLRGTVRDATEAVVPSATVALSNQVTGFSRETRTGSDGAFVINNIPPNIYRLLVSLAGFQPNNVPVTIRTGIPMDINIRLELAGQQSSVTVQATPTHMLGIPN